MLWSDKNLCATVNEAHVPEVRALQQGKPPQLEACLPQLERSPHSNQDPAQLKINQQKQNYF